MSKFESIKDNVILPAILTNPISIEKANILSNAKILTDLRLAYKNIYNFSTTVEYKKGVMVDVLPEQIISKYNNGEIHYSELDNQIYMYIFYPEFVINFILLKKTKNIILTLIANDLTLLNKVKNEIQTLYKNLIIVEKETTMIDWAYPNNKGGHILKSIPFEDDLEYKDSLYPNIKIGIKEYINNFKNSTNNILILIGDPGLGKTSFVRQIIKASHPTKALMSFDEGVFNQEEFYISFVSNTEYEFLILEDSDILLESRDKGSNQVMKRLLNISDGLLKNPNKKIIFTTNLKEINYIDSALRRPGRCYDILKFRELTFDEAIQVCTDYNLSTNLDTRKSEFSLADIFNRQNRSHVPFKVGFNG